jgi:hypothetical protein
MASGEIRHHFLFYASLKTPSIYARVRWLYNHNPAHFTAGKMSTIGT